MGSLKTLAIVLTVAALSSAASAGQSKIVTVRVVTADERKACKYLGLITYRQAFGWNKPGGALKHALMKVQQMGGDSLFIVTEHQDTFAGASVNGEALKCG